jgi:hypothetical protein
MAATAAAIAAVPARRTGFMVSPAYDSVFFIGAPLIALAIGIWISRSSLSNDTAYLFSKEGTLAGLFIGVFTSAHLFLVAFRSHANKAIFKTHPYRFTLVPIGLLLALTISPWIQCAVAVLGTFWDVYHSSLQTFGLGRIYDRRAGNDPHVGRGLDMMLSLLLYAGPIVAGVSLMEHVNDFRSFQAVGSIFFSRIPRHVESIHSSLAVGILLVGVPFIVYYVVRYALLARAGYAISPQKVILLASTAFCSVYTWTFDSFGQAFFIMNFFHALQYFAIVWHSEKMTLTRLLRLRPTRAGMAIALGIFLAIGFVYGVSAEVLADRGGVMLSIFLVVAIMHFWYDGFIWSVRKRQV